MTISDQGPGFPEALKPFLFSPCQSTKEEGSGIGLTISKLLANHLGAELELSETGTQGCIFTLTLPSALFTEQSAVASSRHVR